MKVVERCDSWEVNQVPIMDVVAQYGYETKRKGSHSYFILCPNPNHGDNRLGSCVVNEEKNVFNCFSCRCGGGPINFVMLADEDCKGDFAAAKEKLAKAHGLIRTELVDDENPIERWTGLSVQEYEKFGLQNVLVQIPTGMNDRGQPIYRKERVGLRELAKENPEMHDNMLIGKFHEMALDRGATFLGMLSSGDLFLLDSEFIYSKQWEEAVKSIVGDYLKLLKKGLMDKSRYDRLLLKKVKPLAKAN